jgi:hypothetical protein
MAEKLDRQIRELLYQALETELGGISIYEAAIQCAIHDGLREEWQQYRAETISHRDVLLHVFEELGLDPGATSPGREVCAHLGKALVEAMQMAARRGDLANAQLVATECVVLAETKDHLNWELLGFVAEHSKGNLRKILLDAHAGVEEEEDQHLYHTKGWSRELWIKSLRFKAVLPPPEEIKDVKTAIGAARAENAREQML